MDQFGLLSGQAGSSRFQNNSQTHRHTLSPMVLIQISQDVIPFTYVTFCPELHILNTWACNAINVH